MNTPTIALLSEAKQLITRDALEHIALALQVQLKDHFEPEWERTAKLEVYDTNDDVPDDSWRIYVRATQADGGFHCGANGRPFAVVFTDGNRSETCKTCSHELLEMLVNETGNEIRPAARIIGTGSETVNYVLEICDPCQDQEYPVEDLAVSDFVLPAYFEDPTAQPGAQYSHTGAVQGPLDILSGGYLSWQDPITKEWQMATHSNGLQGPIPLPGSPMDNTCLGMTTRRWVDLQSRRILDECVQKMSDSCLREYRQRLLQIQSSRKSIYNVCQSGGKR